MADFLRYRQIHLDFHTSQQLTNIGGEFDAAAWAQQLVDAHVDSITCFARGHHGMIFYETEAHPERRHPRLPVQPARTADRIGSIPRYTGAHLHNNPVGLLHCAAGTAVAAGGLGRLPSRGRSPTKPASMRNCAWNTSYVDFLKAHVDDMFAQLPAVDGLFFDIVQDQDCSCTACRLEMLAQGLDPSSDAERISFGQGVTDRFKRDMSAHVRGHSKECTIFYNSGHVGPRQRATGETYSHWELESLPSGGWGYMHFPLSQRYARTTGHDSWE